RKCAWEQRCLVPEKRRTSRCASDCMGLSVTAFQSAKTQGRASNQDDDDQLLKEGLPKKWRNRIENHEAEENADVGNAKPSSAVAVDGSSKARHVLFTNSWSWRTIKAELSWTVRRLGVASRAKARSARDRATRRSRDVRSSGAATRQQE